ncbi:hypothetical protein Salat_1844000 [Sesamum alatum]|uniref:Uncharacterized protein n=1 Tax=Sesamum alatum TaxID=300844 RepID=A0AAE2CHT9_9LAMI|nr:hypothetical protein Salat_1844000 [Sesamum alatum]
MESLGLADPLPADPVAGLQRNVVSDEADSNPIHTICVFALQAPRDDHAPLLLRIVANFRFAPASFLFQNMWRRHPNFLKVIVECWALPVHLSGMLRLKEKLLRLKKLRHWNKTSFGDLFCNLTDAETAVCLTEGAYDQHPSEANLLEMNQATTLFQRELSIEEDY